MFEYKIKKNYTYLFFNSDIDMFNHLDILLKDGYIITDSVYLCVELFKNNHYYLLSYLYVDNVDLNIKKSIKALYKKHNITYPDYNKTVLGVISAIRNNFNYDYKYPINNKIFDKKYKKVILLILDGLGLNVLNNNLDDNSFLKRNLLTTAVSIYPSTTAAATTSIKSGLSPISTGWTGWENYLKEIDRNVVLFTGVNYYNDEPTGISLYNYIPVSAFYSDMDVKGYIVEPDFSKHDYDVDEVLNKSLKINKQDEEQIQYVYFHEPDSIMHGYGCYSNEAMVICNDIDEKLEKFVEKLSDDTILIITADHGHTNTKQINLYGCRPILELLERNPSNDGRCITFKVKENNKKKFEILFNSLFKDIYKLYKTDEAIKLGFFGLENDYYNTRCDDFLADYIAVATNEYYFAYKENPTFTFKSHHAGITSDEMIIPICVFRK